MAPRLGLHRRGSALVLDHSPTSPLSRASAPQPTPVPACEFSSQTARSENLPTATRVPDSRRSKPSSPPSLPRLSRSNQNSPGRRKKSPHPEPDSENQSHKALHPPRQTPRYSSHTPTPGRASARLFQFWLARLRMTAEDSPSHTVRDAAPADHTS